MESSTLWWLLAGGAVAVELLTGSFYLLMLALGMAAAALTAHSGGSLTTQIVAAALVGGGAVTALYLSRSRRPAGPVAQANPDVNLDIGSVVQVDRWAADGTASVRYRGAAWTVVMAGSGPHLAGPHRVREVQGSRLVVEKTED